jgi:hypothetical protein
MRQKVVPPVSADTPSPSKASPEVVTPGRRGSRSLLTPRAADDHPPGPPASKSEALSTGELAPDAVFKAKLKASFGCKTSETAVALLEQILSLESSTSTTELARTNGFLNAIAFVAELQPATGAEAMLAVLMVGSQRGAMQCLANATKAEASVDGRDRNFNRALRLMRLFTEQLDAMSKLKGKGTQQRVVVEHVTVAAGGQAIVGAISGGRGASEDDRR